jgi:protein tyrosine kinase
MSPSDGPPKDASLPPPEAETIDGPSPVPEGETYVESSAKTSEPPETRSIGPYRLIRKLGQGGMGQVWLAEQTSPLHRQVALKVVRAGIFNEILLQRFLAERQSLAIMSHPCIAKVFDAGATPGGQPYFVMEYVPGLPITNYCDSKVVGVAPARCQQQPENRQNHGTEQEKIAIGPPDLLADEVIPHEVTSFFARGAIWSRYVQAIVPIRMGAIEPRFLLSLWVTVPKDGVPARVSHGEIGVGRPRVTIGKRAPTMSGRKR